MIVIDALLDSLERSSKFGEACTVEVRVGPFWTVVQTSVGTGVASTMAGEARPHEGFPVREAGKLATKKPVQLAALLRSSSTTEAAIGLAAVNALFGRPQGQVSADKALPILRQRCRGKRAAMIGRFPFAEELRKDCGELVVFERNHRLGPGVVSADEIPQLLPDAEVVAITATTLLNGTLESVLRHVSDDAWLMMLGPSTPMTPLLFEYGFDILCGSFVVDPEHVIAAVSQGATTKQITGVERLSLWRTGVRDSLDP